MSAAFGCRRGFKFYDRVGRMLPGHSAAYAFANFEHLINEQSQLRTWTVVVPGL
jgi:hypothetical protein